ncbi:MAG TPA: hypothetical protein ENK80_03285, partial [Rhodobacterales bacterium]|nr:hypothetical protein [Rhodobacterales bacterium]
MRQFTFTIFATGLLTTTLAGPIQAQQAVAVAGPLAKSVSPEVAPGVVDVEAFVAAAGYAVKGAAPVSGQPQDIATKGPSPAMSVQPVAQAEAEQGVEPPDAEAIALPAQTEDA